MGGRENYRNPCLTMHQPWASLLVHGIKRIEGRSWPAPIRGRLWIHAAGKVPEPETIRAMEEFYREIYAVHGITDIKFPEHYPVSRLLGCVEVVGCLRREELVCWKDVPEAVRLEGLTDFCWLCEHPQKLLVPFEMRGYQRVYNLEKRIFEAAVRGLSPAEGPQPVKFPLPDPRDPFSLKPGSLALDHVGSRASEVKKPPSLSKAIAGARAAATQFSKDHEQRSLEFENNTVQKVKVSDMNETKHLESTSTELNGRVPSVSNWRRLNRNQADDREEDNRAHYVGNDSRQRQHRIRELNETGTPKILAAALRGLSLQ